VRAFVLSCVAYLGIALPSSTLGLLWPSMRVSFGASIGTLGILLAFSVTASVISSAATGRILARLRVGQVLAIGTALSGMALAVEAWAPSLPVFTAGLVIFGLGFGAMDSALNAHAARHFGARDINWMHASYGLGATIGPLLVTVLLSSGFGWRPVYETLAGVQAALALLFAVAGQNWQEITDHVASLAVRERRREGQRRWRAAILVALVFITVETGLEAGAGSWGYIFLTDGRDLPRAAAGAAVAAYWAMMFAGRAVLGPLAERAGAGRVLAAAVMGVPVGAALMTVPGPGALGVAGLIVTGLTAAPVFPLFTVTTTQRTGAADITGMVSFAGGLLGRRQRRHPGGPRTGHRRRRCAGSRPGAARPRAGDGRPVPGSLKAIRLMYLDGYVTVEVLSRHGSCPAGTGGPEPPDDGRGLGRRAGYRR
jgi:fucose permease